MKPTHFATLAATLILLTSIGCSKQGGETASMPRADELTQKVMPEQVAESQAADTQLNHVVQDDSGKTVLYWYDSMVPDKKFDKPGKSPFMDMQLVPKYADGAEERSKP